jgi:hypothetical protein
MIVPKFKEYKKIGQVLRYTAIANNTIINMEDRSLTTVFDLLISYLDLEEVMQARHDRLNKLLCDLPSDSNVSIYLTKIIKKPNLENRKDKDDGIISYLDNKRIEMMNGTPSPQYRAYMALTLQLPFSKDKNSEGIKETFRRLKTRMDNVVRAIKSGMPGSIIQLNSSQITTFLGHLLNHEDVSKGQKISDIFTSDFNASINEKNQPFGYVYYGGMYHAVLGFRAYGERSHLPENTYASLNNIWHHRDLADKEFTIHQQMCYDNKEKSLATAKNRKNMITGRQLMSRNLFRFLEKTPEGLNVNELLENVTEAIDLVETSGERFVNWQYHVHIWDASLEGLERKIDEIMAVVGMSHKMTPEKWNIKAAYFSLFPGCERLDTMKIMLPSYNAADFLPIDLPRKCYDDGKSGRHIRFYSECDELTRFDLFDLRAAAWNGIVCGGTGSGKSFLINEILAQFIKTYKGQVAILDYGGAGAGSYRNLVLNAGGTYLEINFDCNEFSINPFEGPLFGSDGEVSIKFTQLLATLERMILSNSTETKLDGGVRYDLQDLLRKYYKDNNNNEANLCNLNDFAGKYLQPQMEKLYKLLFPFIGVGEHAGPYARFFRTNKRVQNRDICCFDMEGLKGQDQLKNVLVPALIDMICTDILSHDPARQKMLVIDEAWQDLSRGGAIQDFIAAMYRTIRKLGGNCYVITQRFEDVLTSNIGGALTANTHYYYFVGDTHKPEALQHAETTGNKYLSAYDIACITENSMPKRDFYLLTPFYVGKLKFYPTKEFCVLATTNAKEKGIIAKHMARFGAKFVTPEVIEAAKGEL